MPDRVTYRLEEDVARITMDDGKVNVMSTAMLRDLRAAIEEAERAAAIVVLRSACPGIFSAGFDLKLFAANDPKASLEMFDGHRKDESIERIWREVRAIRILEGTSEIMRHIVARDMLSNSPRADIPIFVN
jgi:enoyl-CoA hydratase/carnithine racemase